MSILITSLLVYFSLIQLSAAIQFMLFRNGGFEAIVITNAILIIICIVLFEKKNNEKIPIFNQQDMISFMIFAMFLLPFAYIAVKKGTYEAITNIGGIQVVDSTVHYDSLGYEETRGGYQYNKSYYPRGFHVSTSLVQSDLGVVQRDSSWKTNALIYALQYLIFAALLVYSTIYLATTLLKYFYQNSNKKSSTYEYFTLGITLAIPLLLLYLFLFVQQGFLNYFYVSAAILFASTFLFLEKRKTIGELLISNSFIDKIPLVFFILITIGVSYSWPIFTPVLLLIILLSLLSVDKFSIRKIAHILNSKNILIFILILFHLVAIYFQIHYDAKNGLEATGALSSFNSFFFYNIFHRNFILIS
ncbi:hypothetical protein H6795_05030 [Candidatus Nomurabacteria bacterium]|nr:hypothetical protein [Candidatus Nomurabacteria bacterium]